MDKLLVDNIKEELIKIFKKRFDIDFTKWDKDYYNKNLLGDEIRLHARDLLYIYFDVKSQFNITIPQERLPTGNLQPLVVYLKLSKIK
ncbi:peptide maturation system acyl carrier-related protein [Ruminiclostridium josui]|uniref:peptide maturation system acyl carrier-related protein n=1 Tax=Ruminiclostridium josui TaxID=1499 RepID=UPI000B111B73|nr:peptide maturation system acyl carrier-related protein [Ruminiclostridium josui]